MLAAKEHPDSVIRRDRQVPVIVVIEIPGSERLESVSVHSDAGAAVERAVAKTVECRDLIGVRNHQVLAAIGIQIADHDGTRKVARPEAAFAIKCSIPPAQKHRYPVGDDRKVLVSVGVEIPDGDRVWAGESPEPRIETHLGAKPAIPQTEVHGEAVRE